MPWNGTELINSFEFDCYDLYFVIAVFSTISAVCIFRDILFIRLLIQIEIMTTYTKLAVLQVTITEFIYNLLSWQFSLKIVEHEQKHKRFKKY